MAGPNIGYSTLSVIPSMKGMDRAITSQLSGAEAAGRKAATAVERGMRQRLNATGKLMKSKILGPLQGLAPAAGLAGGILAFSSMKNAASDLGESISKVDVVFAESSPEIQAWSKTAARSIGQSRQQALEAAGTFGNLFRAMGLGVGPTTKMSKGTVELASDLASFNNADPQEVLDALRAGLVGETEPLRKFGVNINAARIEAEAFALGLAKPTKNAAAIAAAQLKVEAATKAAAKATKEHGKNSIEARTAHNAVALAAQGLDKAMAGQKVELTAAQKAQASYSIIMKDTALAQGDFGRTADGAANKQRIQAALFQDLKAKIGNGLIPVYKTLLGVVTFVTENFTAFAPVLAAIIAGFAAYKTIMLISTIATNVFGASLAIATGPIVLIVAAIALLAVAAFVFRDKIAAALGAVGRFFKNIFGGVLNFLRTWGGRILLVVTGPIGLMLLAFRTFKGKVVALFKGIGSGIVGALKAGLNVVIGLLEKGINFALAPARRLSTLPIVGAAIPDLPVIKIPRLASGGDVHSAGLGIIAERGPEMVHLPQGARVTPLPASATRATRNGAATLRLVTGKLSIDEQGVVWLRGLAREEIEADRSYSERVAGQRG